MFSCKQLELILIAPLWSGREWFPDMLNLLSDSPRYLPGWNKLLRQPGRDCYNSNVGSLNLHAWRLSSSLASREVFRNSLPSASLEMDSEGFSSLNTSVFAPPGEIEGKLIYSFPL